MHHGTSVLSPLYRFIINDTYRSELCLLYPPHLIAIAAIYLTFILHTPTRTTIVAQLPSGSNSGPSNLLESRPDPEVAPTPQPRRSSRQALHAIPTIEPSKKPQDPITFLAELNVSLPLIATIAQEIISLYSLWDRYKEDTTPEAPSKSSQVQSPYTGSGSGSPLKRSTPASRSASLHVSSANTGNNSATATPGEVKDDLVDPGWNDDVTPGFLSALLLRMREARLTDMAHPASGRPVAINKMLERTQAAG